MRVALTGQTVYNRATGIAQPHYLGTFVNGLTGSIVDGLSEYLHVIVGIDAYYLRVAPRNEQTDKGQWRLVGVVIALFDKMGHDVSLKMVDIYQRNAECP